MYIYIYIYICIYRLLCNPPPDPGQNRPKTFDLEGKMAVRTLSLPGPETKKNMKNVVQRSWGMYGAMKSGPEAAREPGPEGLRTGLVDQCMGPGPRQFGHQTVPGPLRGRPHCWYWSTLCRSALCTRRTRFVDTM